MDILADGIAPIGAGYEAINRYYRMEERQVAAELLHELSLPETTRDRARRHATALVAGMRRHTRGAASLDLLLAEYKLTSEEGLALMCLAEALLRVPDARTIDDLIASKLRSGRWSSHLGASKPLAINSSALGLSVAAGIAAHTNLHDSRLLPEIVKKLGAPVIRMVVHRMMQGVGRQFVAGETIDGALTRSGGSVYRHSYDMLGEAALTAEDADRYFEAYRSAVAAIARGTTENSLHARPGISVKLSALHPRYEYAQSERVLEELTDRLSVIARAAAEAEIGLTIDAEEAHRLELSLEVIRRVAADPTTRMWEGFGLVVQAYQKRARAVLDWLVETSASLGRRMQVRLVKGGYWDTEIKAAQVAGYAGYPVFTRRATTDLSYLVCAQKLFAAREQLYPMFATHNALTLSTVLELAPRDAEFEFQRLHGMGKALYDQVLVEHEGRTCRVYAPVGRHDDLMPYLVRRLIENGASSSFVNRMVDHDIPVEELVADPVHGVQATGGASHPGIPLPVNMFGQSRRNSMAPDLTDSSELAGLSARMRAYVDTSWASGPIVDGVMVDGPARDLFDPSDTRRHIGTSMDADRQTVAAAVASAHGTFESWSLTPVAERVACLKRAADRLEARFPELMAMLVREVGKTVPDTVAELREAVDFLRYYGEQAVETMAAARPLQGPTGEHNALSYHGRGVFACISPWNFPVAIFTGQISAALVTGNTVVAKPAEQTTLVASEMVRLLHASGVPKSALHMVTGPGEMVGAALCADEHVSGVAFTGSTETALQINRALAERTSFIPKLIAETGGQNAMICDSSALSEQVVTDTIASAFHTAGQRCSALRLLFLQDDVADRVIEQLVGAMRELVVGQPSDLSTDIGPVIDAAARAMLEARFEAASKTAKLLYQCAAGPETEHGHFFQPCAFEVTAEQIPGREIFGPFLHVIRFARRDLDHVIDAINATNYGLTLGVHSRVEETVQHVCRRARVGNIYVNRDIIGAQVGVQPFGGERMSGTGPKAGGPNYLFAFCTERSIADNITASGGNPALVSLDDDGM